VLRYVLLGIVEAVEVGSVWLGCTGAVGVPEVLEVPEVIRCVLLCTPEAVEGGLCLQEVQ